MFLYVADLDRAPSDSTDGISLTQFASRLRDSIQILDQGAVETFDGLLAAVGFQWDHDYSDSLWVEGTNRLYRVADNFPRITASQIVSGVEKVKYSISLVDCEPYLIDTNTLDSAIGENRNAG